MGEAYTQAAYCASGVLRRRKRFALYMKQISKSKKKASCPPGSIKSESLIPA
jgi:hypothetical protein